MDWQMWFAAKSRIEDEPWLARLVDGILRGEKSVDSFFERNPFRREPPRFVRILRYRYRFKGLGKQESGDSAFWERTLEGEWMRPVALGDPALARLLEAYGLGRKR